MKSSNKDQKYLSVGYIKAAHGIRGEVFAVIPSKEWDWAEPEASLWLRKRHTQDPLTPYTLEAFRPHKEGLLIKFKEIPDRNEAERLKAFVLHVPKDQFVSQPGEPVFLGEVFGFEVFDGDALIGEVVGFMDNGAQDLLRLQKKESQKEHLVPFLEVFIDRIDFEEKKIWMRLPEGLIE